MALNPPDWLTPHTTVVTASARLARRLAARYTSAQLAAGREAWEAPDILPWHGWVNRLWEERCWRSGNGENVLQPAQRRVLWQQIIESSAQRDRLLQPAAVATRALDAWDTVQAWGVEVFPAGVFLNEDARAFRGWATAYQRRCSEGGWVDEAMLAGFLARDTGVAASAPRPVVLAGYDELTPVAQALLAAVGNAGPAPTATAAGGARAVRCSQRDRRAEWQAAARWARHWLERDPACSIGIVVPGLAHVRGAVQDTCSDVLVPGALAAIPAGGQSVFSIAAGEPLAVQPLVSHALLLLSWALEPLPTADAGALLCSPFLAGAADEADARARLDGALRRRRDPETGIGAVLGEGARAGDAAPDRLLEGLRALQTRARDLPPRQRAADWARMCSVLLKSAGWPGDRTPTSVEYQVLSAWRDLLGELAALDAVTGPLGFGTALRHLRRLAADRAFQPQTPEAPIQVLDLAGAADMGFDHLWVTGLHVDAWPAAAHPNPFIPLPLQRELAMPRASAEQELARAVRTTAAIRAACPDVVFSWPRQDGETPLRPSPLLDDIADGDPAGGATRTWIAVTRDAGRLETFNDDAGPALPAGTEARGGAALFRNQAACPFRAFAKHRLRAEALDETDVGLDALDRGNLVHAVLQQFWNGVGSHAALTQMDAMTRAARVDAIVQDVVNDAAARRPRVLTPRFAAVERARLAALVGAWLEVELARAPFTVTACEASRPFQLGGLSGQVRMDRVDALADGREVILDYKTGKVPAKPWDGPRPEDPQLPLYAVTGAGEPAAVAFARVVRGDSGFRGTAMDADLLPGVGPAPDWTGTLAAWRGVLLDLATAFERGHAAVDPRNGTVTCRHCDLQPLCRVHELGAAPEPDEETP